MKSANRGKREVKMQSTKKDIHKQTHTNITYTDTHTLYRKPIETLTGNHNK